MEIANYALGAENFLPVQLENDAQHAVRCRMLRPHVDDEFVGIEESLIAFAQFEMREILGCVRH